MEQKYLLVFLVLVVLCLYMINYSQREAFGALKRRVMGYDGLTNNSAAPWGVKPEVREEAYDISKMILSEINKKTDMKYKLGKADQIKTEKVSDGKRYVVDVFIHEVEHHVTRRVIMDFTIMKDNKVNVNKVTSSNAMKYEEKSFMDYPAPELIITDEAMGKNYHIMGVSNSSLPFDLYKGNVSNAPAPSDEYRNWILPLATQEHHLYNLKTKCSNVAFNPTINMGLTEKPVDAWLFDKAQGITSFPHGTSN